MKISLPHCFFGLLLGSVLSASAAPDRSVLLIGDYSRSENGSAVFHGSVSILSKDSAARTEITANEIVFTLQPGNNVLHCSGDVVLRTDGRTIRAKNLELELGSTEGNVYLLNSNGFSLGGSPEKKSAFESWPTSTTPTSAPSFDSHIGSLLPTGRFTGQTTLKR